MSNPMYYIQNQLDQIPSGSTYNYILATGVIPHVTFNFKSKDPDDPIKFAFYTKYDSSKRGSLLHPYTLNDNLLDKPTMEVFKNASFSVDHDDLWCSFEVSALTDNKGSISLVFKPDTLYALRVETASSSDEDFGLSMHWREGE